MFESIETALESGPTGGGFAQGFGKMAPMLMVFGAINSAIGSFYSAKSTEMQLKMQASAFKFQQQISEMNARRAELTAQDILRAGEKQIGRYTMQAGQAKGTTRASMAARGGVLNVGSNMEIRASQDIVTEIDKLTISANAARAAASARTQAANYQVQGLMQGVSAQNAMLSARTVDPWGSAFTSLLGSASNAAPYYAARSS